MAWYSRSAISDAARSCPSSCSSVWHSSPASSRTYCHEVANFAASMGARPASIVWLAHSAVGCLDTCSSHASQLTALHSKAIGGAARLFAQQVRVCQQLGGPGGGCTCSTRGQRECMRYPLQAWPSGKAGLGIAVDTLVFRCCAHTAQCGSLQWLMKQPITLIWWAPPCGASAASRRACCRR
jgi:hypothetical protein